MSTALNPQALLGVLLLAAAAAAAVAEEVPAAVHVHTRWSDGAYSIRETAERARAAGLRAIVLSDSYERAARWGLPPVQGLVCWTKSRPSVRRDDVEAWLAEIAAAARAVPEVAIVPGLEVSPVCEWSGSPWGGGLRAEGLHEHLLVIGTREAEAYESLPTPTSGPLHWDRACARRAALAALLAFCAWTLLRGRARLAAIPALTLAIAWFPVRHADVPLTAPRGVPGADAIAAARHWGLTTSWAHPEALAPGAESTGSGAAIRTLPYPERIVLSTADAFPSIYGDTHTAAGVAREWDRALADYVRGSRWRPVWGLGEADFHGNGAVEIGTYRTVFLVDGPGAAGVERALARGAFYAADRTRMSLSLSATDEATGASAGMGGTLHATGRVRVRALATGPAGTATLRVIRDGAEWKATSGALPLSWEETIDAGAGYLRVTVARQEGGCAVSNPVFLAPR